MEETDASSLWGSAHSSDSPPQQPPSGLHLFPSLLPSSLQHSLALTLSTQFTANSNQIMLFSTPSTPLPAFILSLLVELSHLLRGVLEERVWEMLFSPAGGQRQAILNLYRPGEGIKPHVDLPHRYEDGIIGLSLLSSAVMDFRPLPSSTSESSFTTLLKPGDVYILEGPVRYEYEHGIEAREFDLVSEEGGEEGVATERTIKRGLRMSITLRRLKKGANVVEKIDNRAVSREEKAR